MANFEALHYIGLPNPALLPTYLDYYCFTASSGGLASLYKTEIHQNVDAKCEKVKLLPTYM